MEFRAFEVGHELVVSGAILADEEDAVAAQRFHTAYPVTGG